MGRRILNREARVSTREEHSENRGARRRSLEDVDLPCSLVRVMNKEGNC